MVGPSLSQRLEMLGHAIAHMALEAVAGMRGADLLHQPVARDLGDDRGRGDRRHERVAADHGLAIARHIDAVAAVDEDELRADRKRRDRARQRPEARPAGYCRGRCAPASRRRPRPRRSRRCVDKVFRARPRSSFLESLRPRGMRSGSRMTAAATTGPASGPRPASSQPATGQTPRFIAARSRRKLGRRISSAKGRRAGAAFAGVPVPTHQRDENALAARNANI